LTRSVPIDQLALRQRIHYLRDRIKFWRTASARQWLDEDDINILLELYSYKLVQYYRALRVKPYSYYLVTLLDKLS